MAIQLVLTVTVVPSLAVAKLIVMVKKKICILKGGISSGCSGWRFYAGGMCRHRSIIGTEQHWA